MGRTRYGAGGYGAGDSDVSSRCVSSAVFGNGSRRTWTPSGIEPAGAGGVPGGSRSETVSGADSRRIAALAGVETLQRECVRLRRDVVSGCGLDVEVEYGRAQRRPGDVVRTVLDGRLAPSGVSGRGELDGESE